MTRYLPPSLLGNCAIASVVLSVVFLVAVPDGLAQTTFGSLTGSITDVGGAAVPNVPIEATHVRSNYKYTTQSNEVGNYTLPQLREGEYTLRATAPGFREFVAQSIQLASREERRIDIRLEVGPLETLVEVTAGATLIETETARIGDSKDAMALKILPLNTRSLYSFLALTPGVLGAGGGQATRRFAGSRVNQSEQSIDGITVSNGFDGTQISPLVSYIESFEEVRVDMANNSADIGSVGQVTVVSKSGSNDLHGNLFDYYYTVVPRAQSVCGPAGIWGAASAWRSRGWSHRIPKIYNGRDRSFFFFSFETARGSNVQQLLTRLSRYPRGGPEIFPTSPRLFAIPLTTISRFAGNRIPDNRINPVSRRIQERFYPLPNFGDPNVLTAQNYREQKSRPFDPDTYYTTRIDHRFSERSFLFGRWTWNRSHSRDYEANLPTIGQRWQTRDTRAFNLSYTHTFSPKLVSNRAGGSPTTTTHAMDRWLARKSFSSSGSLALPATFRTSTACWTCSFRE